MTSGNFSTVPVNSVNVNRDQRQRRDLENIEELAESIRQVGLINPIIVTQDHELVAGERRLTAHKLLGYDQIAVQYVEDLTATELHLVELEENVRREDLPWQDHVNAVAEYHNLMRQQNTEWSQDQTAAALNMSKSHINRHLQVKKLMDEGNEEVIQSRHFSSAANYAQRVLERRKTAVLRDLKATPAVSSAEPEPASTESGDEKPTTEAQPKAKAKRYAEIRQMDFLTWAREVQETPYNFLHCDFPYGVNTGSPRFQSSTRSFGTYDDSIDVYWTLLDTLLRRQDNFIAPSAHMIFWFSMNYYQETREKLEAGGWQVDNFLLIWHKSDNKGFLPAIGSQPRRTYETAMLCRRGSRPLVKPVAASFSGPTSHEYHMSEKPKPVLEHFFRMFIDESSLVLDPTCGSGNAIKVAEDLGANWSTGFDLQEEFVERAKENLGLE